MGFSWTNIRQATKAYAYIGRELGGEATEAAKAELLTYLLTY